MVSCEFEWRPSVVGMKHEHKIVPVTYSSEPFGKRESNAAKAVKKHEVDGWRGRTDDATNGHKITKREGGMVTANVIFMRHVPVD